MMASTLRPVPSDTGTGVCAGEYDAMSSAIKARRIRIRRDPLIVRAGLTRSSLVNDLQRELNLPRGSRGLADDSEAAAAHDIRRQAEIHEVEYIEELRAKFQRAQLGIAALPEGRVFN